MNIDKILNKIKPTRIEQYLLNKKVNSFLNKLNKKLKNSNAILGGSVAKNTWLKGNHDIDIFVLFKEDTNASEYLESVLESIFEKVERIHGSRDYFQVIYKNLNFEIVPVKKITKPKEARIITDISPLHVKWIRSKTNKNLENEIRLTKAFAKAQECYGAETYIKGFSGYVLEILTIYYSSFEKLIKAASQWKSHQIIDISKHYEKIDKNKISPLIVIDPIDNKRNAAAALSQEKFKKFINSCNGYLRNKNINFFERRKIILEDLNDKDLIIKVTPKKGKKDIVGTKILKALEYLKKELINEGFNVTEADWYWDDEALLWFKVKSKELPKYKKHYGPPKDKIENVKRFKLKHRTEKIYTEDDRLYINILRKHVHLNAFSQELINHLELKRYIESIKILK